ncbi:hypothetical protein H5410_048053 [Solanum commersonii]|uniref:Uncharacterized protein n=1 Tax=Solanum commersonii TaxID=4109 RepID=A0A9J5XH00_SOLCO|nr:hypothetical protein H5410_048053 [Solanum commersonii]
MGLNSISMESIALYSKVGSSSGVNTTSSLGVIENVAPLIANDEVDHVVESAIPVPTRRSTRNT